MPSRPPTERRPTPHAAPSTILLRRAAWTALAASFALAGCSAPTNRAAEPGSQPTPLPAASAPAQPTDSALRERAIAALLDASRSDQPQVRANAVEGLAAAPTRLEEVARRALTDPNLGVRSVAAMTVGRARLAALAPEVRPLLNDPSLYVRAASIFALVRCAEPVDLSPLATIALEAPQPRLRAHAVFILGELGNDSALPVIREAIRTPLPRASPIEIRLLELQAVEAMIKLGDERELSVVRAALYPARPEDLEAAALAVQILGEVQDRGAIDQLLAMSTFRDEAGNRLPPEIRLGIAAALGKMGEPAGEPLALEHTADPVPSVRAQAAFALGYHPRPAPRAALVTLLDDPDPLVRVAAAAALVQSLRPTQAP